MAAAHNVRSAYVPVMAPATYTRSPTWREHGPDARLSGVPTHTSGQPNLSVRDARTNSQDGTSTVDAWGVWESRLADVGARQDVCDTCTLRVSTLPPWKPHTVLTCVNGIHTSIRQLDQHLAFSRNKLRNRRGLHLQHFRPTELCGANTTECLTGLRFVGHGR